jgi:hypothetical protein
VLGDTRDQRSTLQGGVVAHAEIRQTFDAEGNTTELVMSVDCDVLDNPEALDECVKRAAILWFTTQSEPES